MKSDIDDILNTLLGNEKKQTIVETEETNVPVSTDNKKIGTISPAKIYKYIDKKSVEYHETLLNYHKLAIEYITLTKAIGWYEVIGSKLDMARKEIAEFKTKNDLNEGDMGQIVSIAYLNDYDRKKIADYLPLLAKEIFVFKKDKSIAELARPNFAKPTLKFFKIEEAITPSVEKLSVDDIIKDALNSSGGCLDHPLFQGLRKPRSGCKRCEAIYELNKKNGIKENRNG